MQGWPDPDWPIREQEHQVMGWGDLAATPVLREMALPGQSESQVM